MCMSLIDNKLLVVLEFKNCIATITNPPQLRRICCFRKVPVVAHHILEYQGFVH